MAWATASAGASASSIAPVLCPPRRSIHTATSTPAETPPQMPSPPCQIFSASPRAALVAIEVGDDVIQPGTDQAGGNRPDRDRPDQIVGACPVRIVPVCDRPTPAAGGDPQRNQHRHGDGNAIGSNVERSERDVAPRRAGNRRQEPAHVMAAAIGSTGRRQEITGHERHRVRRVAGCRRARDSTKSPRMPNARRTCGPERVPSCGDWTLEALIEHCATVWTFVRSSITAGMRVDPATITRPPGPYRSGTRTHSNHSPAS